MTRWLLRLTLFSLPLMVGCGTAAEKKTCAVKGKVTWNGAPLPDGDILFRPEDPSKVPEAGIIVDGAFEMQAKPGTNVVEIRACRPSKFDRHGHHRPSLTSRRNTTRRPRSGRGQHRRECAIHLRSQAGRSRNTRTTRKKTGAFCALSFSVYSVCSVVSIAYSARFAALRIRPPSKANCTQCSSNSLKLRKP